MSYFMCNHGLLQDCLRGVARLKRLFLLLIFFSPGAVPLLINRICLTSCMTHRHYPGWRLHIGRDLVRDPHSTDLHKPGRRASLTPWLSDIWQMTRRPVEALFAVSASLSAFDSPSVYVCLCVCVCVCVSDECFLAFCVLLREVAKWLLAGPCSTAGCLQ